MKIIRFAFTMIGLWTCALALLALVLDGIRSLAANELVFKSLGTTWFELHNESLNLTQAVIQRNVHPLVWDPVMQNILMMPSWLIAALLGFLFIFLGRKRRPKVITI